MTTSDQRSINVSDLWASLHRLSIEAENEGLGEVASALRQIPLECGACDEGQASPPQSPLNWLDGEVMKAIEFLYLFFRASRPSQESFLKYVDDPALVGPDIRQSDAQQD